MQYLLFSFIYILTFIIGVIIGIIIPIIMLKIFKINIYKKENKEDYEPNEKEKKAVNITPDIMDEWFNGGD